MNAWKVILSTLVIFVAGVVTGGLLVSSALRIAQIRPRPANGASGPAGVGGPNAPAGANPLQARNRELVRRMDRELDLTTDQHMRIEKIMTASQERTKSIWKLIAPMVNKEVLDVHSEIRAELTPNQQKKFDGFPKPRAGQEKEKHHPATNSGPGILTNTGATDAPTVEALPAKP